MIEVLKFSAIWCVPCKQLAPKFDEISKNPKYNSVVFKQYDVDKAQEEATKFNVRSIPCVIIIKDDVITDRIVGNVPDKITKALDAYIEQ